MAYIIHVCSDTAFENLIAEIIFDDGSMVIISQERSLQQFDASIYLIDLEELMTAIAEAKERLRLLDVPR
jgi:hypothetical protein